MRSLPALALALALLLAGLAVFFLVQQRGDATRGGAATATPVTEAGSTNGADAGPAAGARDDRLAENESPSDTRQAVVDPSVLERPAELRVAVLDETPRYARMPEDRTSPPPLGGAQVELIGPDGVRLAALTSGADGVARLGAVEVDRGLLRVHAEGYLEWTREIDLRASDAHVHRDATGATVHVGLRRSGARRRGFVIDSAGRPVAGCLVVPSEAPSSTGGLARRVGPSSSGLIAPAAVTTETGMFEIDLPRGVEQPQLLLCPQRPDLAPLEVYTLRAAELDTGVDLMLRLSPAVKVELVVREPDGSPAAGTICITRGASMLVPGCEDRLAGVPGLDPERGLTRRPGSLTLSLPPGGYVLVFQPADAARDPALFPFRVAETESEPQTFRLTR